MLKKEGIKGIQECVKEYLDPTAQKTTRSLSESAMNPTPKTTSQLPETKTSNQFQTFLKYVDSKLQEIKIYEGSIAQKAKDLKTFLKVFEKNEDLMEKLNSYSPNVGKKLRMHMQNRNNSLNKTLER